MKLVVKVGTHAIAARSGRPDYTALRRLVAQLCRLRKAGDEVFFVSSGAVAAGVEALGLKARPTDVNDVQMCAAVGQARFIGEYERLFGEAGVKIGQVLLTHYDFEDRRRSQNVKKSLDHLVKAGIVPIINENDVVADEELKGQTFGDNDWLSFLIAKLMNVFSKEKVNPLIGSAGVSAVPMAARVSNKVSLGNDPTNFILMQAMGPNVSGVIGSAVVAGVLYTLCR